MTSPAKAEPASRATAAAKVVSVGVATLAAFLCPILLGLAADGHGLYSDDYYAWFRTTEEVTIHAVGVGGAVMWLFAVFGGECGRSVRSSLLRAATGCVVALLVWLTLPQAQLDTFTKASVVLCIAGSIAACIFAGRHSWRIVALACAPYFFVVLVFIAFAAFSPPNLGPQP